MVHFDGVFFDLYETLVTEFDPTWRPGPTTADRLDVPEAVFTEVWQSRHADRMTSDLDFRTVLWEACAKAGHANDPERGKIIESLHVERLAGKARTLVAVDSGVLQALDQLGTAGLRLGLISNCAIEEVAGWPDSPLASRFDAVTFSCGAGCAKPDPAIYRQACQSLGVAPGRAAFVGDGGSDELAGAKTVGLTAYCARWFLDQWPAERRDRDAERRRGFPAIMDPAELVMITGRP